MEKFTSVLAIAAEEPVGATEAERLERGCAELTAGLDVTWAVLTMHGESGGWPDVEFTGSREQLHQLHVRYEGGEGVDADDLDRWVVQADA